MTDITIANESMLEIAVNAAAVGHDLGGFDLVGDALREAQSAGGYQTKCRICGRTAWIGVGGVRYSLLGDGCSRGV